jgi:Family of unknown function (DUF5675)
MRITVLRDEPTPQSTEGTMYLDGRFECYTLEPPTLQPPTKPRAIPAGVYNWQKYLSPKMGFEVILLLNVPDFTGVEIHPGNDPDDTIACTVVGTVEQDNFVGHSREAFAELMAKLPDSGTIDYVDKAAAAVRQQDQNNPDAGVH